MKNTSSVPWDIYAQEMLPIIIFYSLIEMLRTWGKLKKMYKTGSLKHSWLGRKDYIVMSLLHQARIRRMFSNHEISGDPV